MRGVHRRLNGLQPVEMTDAHRRKHVRGRVEPHELEVGKGRRIAGSEVHPHDPGRLVHRIVVQADLRAETVVIEGLGRDLDAAAGDVVFPTVEDTAQGVFLIAGERQRDPAVWAGLVEEADAAVGRTKSDEVLAEQARPDGCTVGNELLREECRDPDMLAQHPAHRCVAADAG
jgi:hypothetical protein